MKDLETYIAAPIRVYRNFKVCHFLPGDLRPPWPVLRPQSTDNDICLPMLLTNVRDTYSCQCIWLCLRFTSIFLLTHLIRHEQSND